MALSTPATSIPISGPQFLVSRGAKVPSVQLTLEHNALPVRPTRHSDNSRDLLKKVQKEDNTLGKKKKGRLSKSSPGSRELTPADKVLLQKGIILSERPRRDSLPIFRSSSPIPGAPESGHGASKLFTIGRHALSSSPQARVGVEIEDNLIAREKEAKLGSMSDSPLLREKEAKPESVSSSPSLREKEKKPESMFNSLDTLLNLETVSSAAMEHFGKVNKLDLVDVAGSPDSGYANTPDTGLHTLSPHSRSRSVSSENSSTVEDTATRRVSPSSGLWSGHESTLEFVTEEDTFRDERKEEGEEEIEKRESLSSDEGSTSDTHNHSSSPCEHSLDGTLTPELSSTPETVVPLPDQLSPAVEPGSKYFHPQDDVLIHINPRRQSKMGPGSSSTMAGCRTHQLGSGHGRRGSKMRPRALTATGTKGEMSSRQQNSYAPFQEKDTFQTMDELSKENYHFALSEALLSVIEEYKATLLEQTQEDHFSLPGLSCDSPPISSPLKKRSLFSDPVWDTVDAGSPVESSPPLKAVSLLELMHAIPDSSSAEATAQGMLQHVAKRLGGQVEFRMPQVIQLPTDFITSIKREEELQYSVTPTSSPLRGSHDWAPPRQQVIHTVRNLPKNVNQAFAQQAYRCAGCGMIMDISQVRYYRFCHYTGKFFCLSCHHNTAAVIPAHVIAKWSFKRLPVSNFARDTLANIEREALFNLESLNQSLYSKVPELAKAKDLRQQLLSLRKYIMTCRMAESIQAKFSDYGHWTSAVDTYSLDDFLQVKAGAAVKSLRAIVTEAERHIKSCIVCEGKGFVCELCQQAEIIFPFELQKVSSCQDCHCCFHQECFMGKCPRCERIKERQRKRLREVMMDPDNVGENDEIS